MLPPQDEVGEESLDTDAIITSSRFALAFPNTTTALKGPSKTHRPHYLWIRQINIALHVNPSGRSACLIQLCGVHLVVFLDALVSVLYDAVQLVDDIFGSRSLVEADGSVGRAFDYVADVSWGALGQLFRCDDVLRFAGLFHVHYLLLLGRRGARDFRVLVGYFALWYFGVFVGAARKELNVLLMIWS